MYMSWENWHCNVCGQYSTTSICAVAQSDLESHCPLYCITVHSVAPDHAVGIQGLVYLLKAQDLLYQWHVTYVTRHTKKNLRTYEKSVATDQLVHLHSQTWKLQCMLICKIGLHLLISILCSCSSGAILSTYARNSLFVWCVNISQ